MKIVPLPRDCWHGQKDDIHFGSTLQLDHLQQRVAEMRLLKQIHSAAIFTDETYACPPNLLLEGDGLVTDRSDTVLVVKTADCLPIVASDGRRLVALHAGWRGLKAGIVMRLGEFLNPVESFVIIGPAICTKHYEVDRDLYEPWLADEPELSHWLHAAPAGGSKRLLDTRGFAKQQLQQLGFPVNQIKVLATCTFGSQLPSWRREHSRERRLYTYIYRSTSTSSCFG